MQHSTGTDFREADWFSTDSDGFTFYFFGAGTTGTESPVFSLALKGVLAAFASVGRPDPSADPRVPINPGFVPSAVVETTVLQSKDNYEFIDGISFHLGMATPDGMASIAFTDRNSQPSSVYGLHRSDTIFATSSLISGWNDAATVEFVDGGVDLVFSPNQDPVLEKHKVLTLGTVLPCGVCMDGGMANSGDGGDVADAGDDPPSEAPVAGRGLTVRDFRVGCACSSANEDALLALTIGFIFVARGKAGFKGPM
jgi:hypothetical protein